MTDDPQDLGSLFEEAYDELRRLAAGALRRRPAGATLQPTTLVNEAWLRLGDQPDARTNGREHFLALAALAMRQIRVDAARRRGAVRRGGGAPRVTLVDSITGETDGAAGSGVDLLDFHDALLTLAVVAPRPARISSRRRSCGSVLRAAGSGR